ncbi:AbrB/MazE/SpoVT family DNA-binding domain-containing protein [soil metagenome]
MGKATLTSKGQVTIPKAVREQLGLKSGDRLVFEIDEDFVRLRVDRAKSLSELKGSLHSNREYVGKDAERQVARRDIAGRHVSSNAGDPSS